MSTESEGPRATNELQAAVMGRLGIDLYPNEHETPLREVRTFTRFVGGFAGNVATGLARLGVGTAILSRVGDEGHGEYVRAYLESEGVDTGWLAVDPLWQTPPTFCEIWPPDNFPILYYRYPTVPDWQLRPDDFDSEAVDALPLLYGSGTGLVQSPSRETTLATLEAHRGITVFDLDYRPMLWADAGEYRRLAWEAISHASLVIGNQAEFEASVGSPQGLAERTGLSVIEKRGPHGTAVFADGESVELPPHEVEVVNGLGAGDAFAAAVGWRLLEGDSIFEAAAWGSVAGGMVAAEHGCTEAMPRRAALSNAMEGWMSRR